MNLREFQGKHLLQKAEIRIPASQLFNKDNIIEKLKFEKFILKIQSLKGKRSKNGGIKISNKISFEKDISELFSLNYNEESIKQILCEELIKYEKEIYLGITFDTKIRQAILIISLDGGVDIEDVKKISPEKIFQIPFDINSTILNHEVLEVIDSFKFELDVRNNLSEIIEKLYSCFKVNDLKFIEINPLVLLHDGTFTALDCKSVIDDNALKRQNFEFEEVLGFRTKTENEINANKIDESDHKGVAGKSYIDLDGDIAILASGGGASLVAMDAILCYGGKPANYTEYSGNPPPYKVSKLAKIVLNKNNISALWIVGAKANFTRIDDTIKAIADVLIELKPKFPIIVRRAGPGDKEAYNYLKKVRDEHSLDIHLFDENVSITESARELVKLSQEFKNVNIN